MSWNSKVVWSEGMLLQPQHMQQHDRYLQSQLEMRVGDLRPYPWGFTELKIDEQQLALGKVALLSCSGVLPDGTPFSLPADDDLPLPLDVPAEARNALVFLALPIRRPGIPETTAGELADTYARHQAVDYEAWDSNGLDNQALLQVGRLRVRLALEPAVAQAYTGLGVARIIERRADNRVVTDPDYCPPCMRYRVAPRIGAYADELLGLLRQRGGALADRLSQPGVNGVAEIADFLLLQLINRAQPLFTHLAITGSLHPEALYREMVQLAGELATFTRDDKRAARYPEYRHDHLAESFSPVMQDLRQSLASVMDPHAFAIPLEERQNGFRLALIQDKALLSKAAFVLAVTAHVPSEAVRNGLPPQMKIGSVEKIRYLVDSAIPGIGLRPLPVAPRQLPFHAGYTYFELDQDSEYWTDLHKSAGFGMHLSGGRDFPGLKMQFWAIRR